MNHLRTHAMTGDDDLLHVGILEDVVKVSQNLVQSVIRRHGRSVCRIDIRRAFVPCGAYTLKGEIEG